MAAGGGDGRGGDGAPEEGVRRVTGDSVTAGGLGTRGDKNSTSAVIITPCSEEGDQKLVGIPVHQPVTPPVRVPGHSDTHARVRPPSADPGRRLGPVV